MGMYLSTTQELKMKSMPVFVGQQCFNMEKEGSLAKRLKAFSLYENSKPFAGYLLDVKRLPMYSVSASKKKGFRFCLIDKVAVFSRIAQVVERWLRGQRFESEP
jgi:hypothetical protein